MTAKKKEGSAENIPAKKTLRKAARKQPAKKTSKNPSGKASISPDHHPPEVAFPPEILADLASKLVHLKTDTTPREGRSAFHLAHSAFDADFDAALKRAEMLLLSASGKSDEDVHAYQLFNEQDGSMTFAEIAKRCKECEWRGMESFGGVKPIIVELVIAAELEVQKEREKYDRLLSVRSRYPRGLHYVVDRVTRHICNMIKRTDLRDLVDDPQQAANVTGQFFIRLMEDRILGDWKRHLDEEYATLAGFESFIEHVCDGLSYEQFIPDPSYVWLDLERLGCFVSFLKELRSLDPTGYESAGLNLEVLMRLVRGRNNVPTEAMSDLNACLEELGKVMPVAARVQELTGSSCQSLKAMWDRWHLTLLARAQEFSKLISELGDCRSELNPTEQFSTANIEQILGLLRRANEMGGATENTTDAGEIRQLLDELRQSLGDPDLISASMVAARRFNGTIADELKRVADGLEKGLQAKPLSNLHATKSLNDLLSVLKPYSGDRKCRPYELFLFAAQNQIANDKLVRKRSSLAAGFIPNPKFPLSLSILTSHRGAKLH